MCVNFITMNFLPVPYIISILLPKEVNVQCENGKKYQLKKFKETSP